ncbi:hypothetical protein [Cesiribacter andamanensis]|uniref:hypothetical protein n=1 Tax=Cesiribacter andamanensis TaxID=649507 RepID=UPI001268CEC6|nr:hypothetical protein [Cesiribacter andamanensis]
MRVLVVKSWGYPNIKQQTPLGDGIWRDMEFIFVNKNDEIPDLEYDYLVVLSFPVRDLALNINKKNTLLLTQEPPYDAFMWFEERFKCFNTVLTQFPVTSSNIISSHPLCALVGRERLFIS